MSKSTLDDPNNMCQRAIATLLSQQFKFVVSVGGGGVVVMNQPDYRQIYSGSCLVNHGMMAYKTIGKCRVTKYQS